VLFPSELLVSLNGDNGYYSLFVEILLSLKALANTESSSSFSLSVYFLEGLVLPFSLLAATSSFARLRRYVFNEFSIVLSCSISSKSGFHIVALLERLGVLKHGDLLSEWRLVLFLLESCEVLFPRRV